MIQRYTTYATVTKLYRYEIEVEDGSKEDEEPSHEQSVAVDEKLEEIEQSLGDYLGNELDPEQFINQENAPPEVKSVDYCPGDDDWSLETNCD
tara:strand:+ start:3379 stop:3657 length:279 start_codon:yes stop_codon:yes gene_type:complete